MDASRKTRATHEEINSEVENSIGGIRLTKAFTNEEFELEKFKSVNHEMELVGNYFKTNTYETILITTLSLMNLWDINKSFITQII